ncbi:MAG: endolytic transglycosylase MltG [Kofleriaceae bacterium]|nr:endolytic transglycosylase MltG [Kofleriaceae bacterium]
MSKRSFRVALAVVIGSVILVVGIAGWFVHRALSYPDEAHAGSGREVEVEIKTGMSFPAVASLLADKHVVTRPTWFRLYAMWEGDTTNIKPGKYLIKDNLTPKQVLKVIVTGVKETTIKVTLPEGKNMLEYFELIGKACPAGMTETPEKPCPHIASAKELEAAGRDKEFLAQHAIAGDSVEGYLFPDTYEFRAGEKPRTVLERLITRHQEVWHDVLTKNPKDTAKLKDKLRWTDHEILTMASIVEKEAVEPAERPRIAQVFINRLVKSDFKPHRLETDPTIRYGCLVPEKKSAACIAWNEPCAKQGLPVGCDRLHRAQLDDVDNPYNTYRHEGLPPGPISNPGRRSIEAVISPDGSDYLYFVAKNDREHVFSKTVQEHERNVTKYQR